MISRKENASRWRATFGNAAGALILLALAAIVTAACRSKTEVGEGKARALRSVEYGRGYTRAADPRRMRLKPLLMDVMFPAGPSDPPRPAIIILHGGGFEDGSRHDTQQVDLARHLVAAGYVCFLPNYRLLRDDPPAPPQYTDPLRRAAHAAVVDAKTALRHVYARAADYGVDPERIALLGSSAGAIAALAAGLSQPDQFAADTVDLAVPAENHPETPARAAAIVNLWGTADFFTELFGPHAPPIMTVHGAKDFQAGLSVLPVVIIALHCERHGIPHRAYVMPEHGHGAWDAVVDGKPLHELIVDFLRDMMPGDDTEARPVP